MNLLALVGSSRKGKATDTLVEAAVAGVRDADPDCRVKKVYLGDRRIEFCRGCLLCRDSADGGDCVRCAIRDDMDELSADLLASDLLLLGTPIHMGFAPGLVTNFLERICWTFGKPTGRVLGVKGCPEPRGSKTRRAGLILTNGIVPPLYRRLCDRATPLVKDIFARALNARLVGSLYAGAVESRGLDPYLDKARRLGARIALFRLPGAPIS